MEFSSSVLVVGAGVGGLTAAIELSNHGFDVVVLEKAPRVGGKMRQVHVGNFVLDAGPTVLTMRKTFDEVFAAAGDSLDRHITLDPVDVLARHYWTDGSRLDLYSDMERSADAIGQFAGLKEANGYRRFCDYSRTIYETVKGPFMDAERPTLVSVVKAFGTIGIGSLLKMDGYRTLWTALSDFFRDPRLLQLFGRYATYSGSSPFSAPATLNVIAHVEREGVWLVRGGMYKLAEALVSLCEKVGVKIRTGVSVHEVLIENGRATGVRLDTGETLRAGAVVLNADTAALASGLFGKPAKKAIDAPGQRSLSAMTWAMAAKTEGVPLIRHNVFFSTDYAREFHQLFDQHTVPDEPTVYICAQDRNDLGENTSQTAQPGSEVDQERLFCLINAPATGDSKTFTATEIKRCETRMKEVLSRAGLRIAERSDSVVTTPKDFEKMFPATGGALYGAASHGVLAPFSRPSGRSKIPGLYLCGGSAHPGAGVPMAAQSGRLAALALRQDQTSRLKSKRAVTLGGMSMP